MMYRIRTVCAAEGLPYYWQPHDPSRASRWWGLDADTAERFTYGAASHMVRGLNTNLKTPRFSIEVCDCQEDRPYLAVAWCAWRGEWFPVSLWRRTRDELVSIQQRMEYDHGEPCVIMRRGVS